MLVLNETLPGNLKSIAFTCRVYSVSNHSLDILMKNWRGPKPLAVSRDSVQLSIPHTIFFCSVDFLLLFFNLYGTEFDEF